MFRELVKLNLKSLDIFMVIVECKGMTPAQTRLNISQSAMSNHLTHLESVLGVVLCKRGRKGFELTEAGGKFYSACLELERSTRQFNHYITDIKFSEKRKSGKIEVGIVDNLPQFFKKQFVEVLKNTHKNHPQVSINISVHQSNELQSLITRNKIDLAIGGFPTQVRSLKYTPFFKEKQTLYAHKNHDVFALAHLNLDVLLHQFPWVKREYLVDNDKLPFTPLQKDVANEMEVMLLILSAGTHIGYLPESYVASLKHHDLKAILEQDASYDVQNYLLRKAETNDLIYWFENELLNMTRMPDWLN